jgi:hypothetical protein
MREGLPDYWIQSFAFVLAQAKQIVLLAKK